MGRLGGRRRSVRERHELGITADELEVGEVPGDSVLEG